MQVGKHQFSEDGDWQAIFKEIYSSYGGKYLFLGLLLNYSCF